MTFSSQVFRSLLLSYPVGSRSLRGLAAVVGMLGGATTSLAAQQPGGSVFFSPSCPIPAGLLGYPVAVQAPDAPAADSAFLTALADALVRRWEPPSPGRGRFTDLSRVTRRAVTPEPLWSDDWSPESRHVARMSATLHRNGPANSVTIRLPSGDRVFDRSLSSIFASGAAKPEFPGFPESLASDTLHVIVSLGELPIGAPAGHIRFAAQQSPVRVVHGTLQIIPPASSGRFGDRPSATVKYDVNEQGRVVPGSIQVLRSSDSGMSRAVTEGLQRASFTPGMANCRPITRSVVQQFGDR